MTDTLPVSQPSAKDLYDAGAWKTLSNGRRELACEFAEAYAALKLAERDRELQQAREELARLKEALIKYGNHLLPCERAYWNIKRWPEYPCTCGFDSALAVPEKPDTRV